MASDQPLSVPLDGQAGEFSNVSSTVLVDVTKLELVKIDGKNDKEGVEKCIGVRVEVFVDEQGFTMDQEVDGLDSSALHFLLCLREDDSNQFSIPNTSKSGTPIATLRVFPPFSQPTNPLHLPSLPNNTQVTIRQYQIARIAVLKGFRSIGAGKKMLSGVMQWIEEEEKKFRKERGGNDIEGEVRAEMILHSQNFERTRRFYENLGFTPRGELYEEDGMDHIDMVKAIANES